MESSSYQQKIQQLLLLKDKFPKPHIVKGAVHWGYEKTEDNHAVPNIEQLKILSECFDYLDNGRSLRECVEYIKSANYEISIMGLRKLWLRYRPSSQILQERRQNRKEKKAKAKKEKFDSLNKAEQEALKQKLKIAAEKRRITVAKKRLDALEGKVELQEKKIEEGNNLLKSPVVLPFEALTEEEVKEDTGKDVVFRPNPGPQTDFLAASEREVLYGGSAGGGKSYALIADPMRYFSNPNFNGLLLRRTNDELRELVWETKKLYPKVFGPKAVFKEKASEWQFPSGGRLWMSYLDRDDDVMRYQGQAFSWIGFDELTQYPSPFAWDYLRSRLRSTDPELKKTLCMRGTTNPGGPGHGWVKRMFIDPAPAGSAFPATDIDTGAVLVDPETNEPLFQRRFIPARLKDNPYLAEDGIYRTNLLSLPEARRAQLLEGDWTMADGAAFPEFRRSKHVVKPFEIPRDWYRFRSADFGYASHSCVLWFAIDPMDEQLIVYRELYVSKKTGEDLARMVNDIEAHERVSYGILDSSVWHKRGEGPSIAEVMIAKGCRWKPSDRSAGSRVAGKNRLHELLKVDEETGRPGIVFFENCSQIISDLEVIPIDPNDNDDIDKRYRSDHSYDALRYGIMSRPKTDPWWDTQRTITIRPADPVFGY